MGALFIFLLISVLLVSALLFFNKGEKAQEIKSILSEIYKNLKELFSNFKKLFVIVKDLIQEKLDQEPTKLKDDSTESQPEVIAEPKITSEPEVLAEPALASEAEVISEPEIIPTSKEETPSEDSVDDEKSDEELNNFN